MVDFSKTEGMSPTLVADLIQQAMDSLQKSHEGHTLLLDVTAGGYDEGPAYPFIFVCEECNDD